MRVMALMQWTTKMSVGVPELDDDHKKLIAIINRLAEQSSGAPRQAILRQCLFALRRYAEAHFGREEKVMTACGYPELGRHKDEHQRFVERIREITERFDQDPDQEAGLVDDDLLEFLRDWLTHHILIEDMAYRPHAEKRLDKVREAARSFRAVEIWHSE
jgi:hemerythrin